MEASGVGASHSGDQGQKQRPSPSKHREHRGVWVVQKLMRIERESSSGVTRGLIKRKPFLAALADPTPATTPYGAPYHLNPEAARVFVEDRAAFDRMAAAWVAEHAQ